MTRISEEQIRTLVFAFYERVREDPILGPVFEARLSGRWDPHLEKMCDFWSTVLLASGRFRGNPIAAHTAIPGLHGAHFDRWIEIFERTASATLPPHMATDVAGRSKRMRVTLERAACSTTHP